NGHGDGRVLTDRARPEGTDPTESSGLYPPDDAGGGSVPSGRSGDDHGDDPAPTAGRVTPPPAADTGEKSAPSLVVRLLGGVELVDADGRAARIDRSKTLELLAWIVSHRDRSTRSGARTALWDLDVRDTTFANVVSDARRTMARHVTPP